jgi:hypothetical protein
MSPLSAVAASARVAGEEGGRQRQGGEQEHGRRRADGGADDPIESVDGVDNSDAPDVSTLVPQDGAVVDDVDHQRNETPRSELAGVLHLARSWSTALVCIWQTRDSVTPGTCPISARVRPS